METMMDGMFGDGNGNGNWNGAGAGNGAAAEGPASACGLDGLDAGGAGGTGGAAGGMILEIGGEWFDLGPGVGDGDDDGIADSVTLADDRGLSIYSDVDGDGTVDHVTTVLFDGTYETWTAAAASDSTPKSSGGTPSGVWADSVDKRESPSTWGAHEWERGERGRWA